MLHVCPTCNQGVKQSRGWSWIDPRPWLEGPCAKGKYGWASCPAFDPERFGEKVGLLWIGERFYSTPEDFVREGHAMGWSRRIRRIPRGFEVGKHWVFLAHPKVKMVAGYPGGPLDTWQAGIFHIWRPTRVEQLVTDLDALDAEKMEALEKRGITPVIVPHTDPRHQGTVWDDDKAERPELPLS